MRLFVNSLGASGGGSVQDPNVVNVYLLTGQSNSRGRALNSEAQAGELDTNSQIQIYNTSANEFQDLNIGVNNLSPTPSLYHGIELYMSVNSAALFGSNTVYLIKYGEGSTCIAEHQSGGSVYNVYWPQYVQEGINALINQGKKCRVKMIWAQGECDFANNNTNYASDFTTWAATWRANIGAQLPIVAYQISDELWADAYLPRDVSQINDAIATVAASDSYMTALDTKNEDCNADPDTVHYSYAGQKAIGAKAFAALATYSGQLVESTI